ncbi:MAG: hypothetical protein HGA35_07050, partial [Erysipelotrichaceae bacterium]|nr:hypothetical protein [Erysipelotrichaceae bacterium]
ELAQELEAEAEELERQKKASPSQTPNQPESESKPLISPERLKQVEDEYIKYEYHRKHTGLNHLAFHGGSREFVDTITLRLKEKNVTILYLDKHPYAGGIDYYAVFFEDPNRIKVEICAN